ncbi:Protein BOLA4, chloroplastic/mitochondrial [Linum perenne]
MAKTLMARPQILSSTTTHFILLRRALNSSSLPSPISSSRFCPRSSQFRSYSTSFTRPITSELQLHSSRCNLFSSGFGASANRRFAAGATPVNDAGSIDSPLMASMKEKIMKELDAESVTVKDAYGDGRHVRQRMVYKAIWEELQSTVHAVDQMTTKTPSEASNK